MHALALLLGVLPAALAAADPLITPAAEALEARQASNTPDPSFVGYISSSGSFNNPRSCAYPQTVSTSGSFFQCCNATGPCVFYTQCMSNTLFAASATVACDVDPGLACNTAIVEQSVGASGGASYLACWQTSLGSAPFTFVQDIGSATPVVTSMSGSGGGGSSSATTSAQSTVQLTGTRTTAASTGTTMAGSQSSSAQTQASSSTAHNAAAGVSAGVLEGGLLGLVGYLAQMLI